MLRKKIHIKKTIGQKKQLPKKIRCVKEFYHSHTDLKLEEYLFSEDFYLSKSTPSISRLSKQFSTDEIVIAHFLRYQYGAFSPKELAIQMRLSMAQDLMNTKLSIRAIAKLCNFANTLQFIWLFTLEFNRFPFIWRKELF